MSKLFNIVVDRMIGTVTRTGKAYEQACSAQEAAQSLAWVRWCEQRRSSSLAICRWTSAGGKNGLVKGAG